MNSFTILLFLIFIRGYQFLIPFVKTPNLNDTIVLNVNKSVEYIFDYSKLKVNIYLLNICVVIWCILVKLSNQGKCGKWGCWQVSPTNSCGKAEEGSSLLAIAINC